jgi:hypothetical protein
MPDEVVAVAQELTMLVEIDFLPAAYRERSIQRRAYAWRVAAAVLIVGFFVAASLWQRSHHARILAKLAAVESQFADAAASNARLAQITTRLDERRKTADLLTFLRHRWPSTRIMAAVLEPLPATVVLVEWHVGSEARPADETPSIALPEAKTIPPDMAARRANDLQRLLHESSRQQQFVHLAGRASDAATLHEYLARLGASPLFEQVDLQSLEHVTSDPDAPAAESVRFTVRAILRPGHGATLPSKPAAPAPSPAPLAQRGA